MTKEVRAQLLRELRTTRDHRRAREIVAELWRAWPSSDWLAEQPRKGRFKRFGKKVGVT